MLILFDYGHGGTDPGATYKGRKESDDVLRLGQAVAKTLREQGFKVDETRTTNKYLTLQQRVKIEHQKKYDYFISFHRNAFKPEIATGVEVYIYQPSSKAKPLAEQIQNSLVNIGYRNRGIKTANFYVLKHTKAPAILVEVGFIDNTKDNKLFDTKFNEITNAIASAITMKTKTTKKVKCSTCGQYL